MTNADEAAQTKRIHVSAKHHMTIHWHRFVENDSLPVLQTSLKVRSTIVGRIGIMMLECGTGAWRVREGMDKVARALGLTCSTDVGLNSINYTCFSKGHHYSQTLALPSTGVNTDKLHALEDYSDHFATEHLNLTAQEIHNELDQIRDKPANYNALVAGIASAFACGAFVFLLGGSWVEMICAFFGAGVGHYSRRIMGKYKITLFAKTALSVALACIVYLLAFRILELTLHVASAHEAGYIGAMLFVIPGFPLITSGLDIFKSDMRSGLERLTSAVTVIAIATIAGWFVAMAVHLRPENFLPQNLSFWAVLVLRIIASFVGVFGFSMMFNSPPKMAALAGTAGAVANTLRLELADFKTPAALAAFVGALVAGLLASYFFVKFGLPRISLTVPAIVIMVPGLYMYRAVYNLGINNFTVGGSWLIKAIMMVVALPLGLATARVLTDKQWRKTN
ncbi:threonine/serine exporter family protein [Lacticaseibacillus pabuli]|uniref:Threonine/serine exporter family protein n=1 Tax=Lacticaseibacillus pabuli TaxID=3025672 RepID=A0ABY7WPH2_9LACO|nr:threonine/serine exporter family protein [Lacticaseibacillus sp. KACC 23028]WDF82097.1 threonine/serine exporter family protein [Lacticaseibacillus sp. KACC 23028]